MLFKTLTIAGFDGIGGAGIQADLKTFAALGCYGLSVLTALPVQNTCGVRNCYELPASAISEQLAAIFDDITPDAIKIGMVYNQQIIEVIADFLRTRSTGIPLVVDPVMIASSGDRLLQNEAIQSLITQIFPLATLVTPNLVEAQALSGLEVNNMESMEQAGSEILACGAKAILLKGGHLPDGQCNDLLLTSTYRQWFQAPQINTRNTHGTGCTLSAAITAGLARGLNLTQSCQIAKNYLNHAMAAMQMEVLGKGHGPVNHFYHLWPALKLFQTQGELI